MKTETKETLHFLRMATKAKNGRTGVLYVHNWATGYQELIFDDHESAKRFEAKLNTPEYLERLKLPA